MLRKLLNVLSAIGTYFENAEKNRRDAYLNEASDIYDLEYRIRELDRRDRDMTSFNRAVTGTPAP